MSALDDAASLDMWAHGELQRMKEELTRLRAEVEALKATCKQLLQVQRYELVYDELQEDDDGDWVMWIDVEATLRGEGE